MNDLTSNSQARPSQSHESNIGFTDLVTLDKNNKPGTDSLKVAAYFNKLHKNVLQDIRTLIDRGAGLNFQPVEIIDKNAIGGNVNRPYYAMDQRGFILLAMGFTGEEAFKFKVDFLDAFEMMENRLKEQQRLIAEQNNAIVRGVLLEKWLKRLKISFDTLATYHGFRVKGLTQREIALALGMSRDKAKMVEKMLKEFGIEFAGVKYTQRQAFLARRLESILAHVKVNPNPERAALEVM